MKRVAMLTLGLWAAPVFSAAQVEIGLDAGVVISAIAGADDHVTSGKLAAEWGRVAFVAADAILLETLLGFEYYGEGDYSENALLLMPGLNYLLGERFYVRVEAGLTRYSESDTGADFSQTQYGFGGAAGLRMPLGDTALVRAEVGVDRWLEVEGDGGFVLVAAPARTDTRVLVGVSAVIG
jgi:hypothetical protein